MPTNDQTICYYTIYVHMYVYMVQILIYQKSLLSRQLSFDSSELWEYRM